MTYNIWFNKGFSVTQHLIRAMTAEEAWNVVASHTKPLSPMLAGSWQSFLEPRNVVGEQYVEYCLDTCKTRDIAVFFAAKESLTLAQYQEDFAKIGTQLIITAQPETADLLDDKARFMSEFPQEFCPLPAHRVFGNLAEFEQGITELTEQNPSAVLCFKPSRGIYASGFRVLHPNITFAALMQNDLYRISYHDARECFAREQNFAPMLLMHYCEGVERSIDALAWQGKLVGAVVRRKAGESKQILEDHPLLVELAKNIAQHYQLSGIFNFQTRDLQGVPHLLEINARASGGIHISLHSGFNFAHYAAQLALGLGSIANIPKPQNGIEVFPYTSSIARA